MAAVDNELTVIAGKKYTPPPSALQQKHTVEVIPHEKRTHLVSPSFEQRSRVFNQRQATAPAGRISTKNAEVYEMSMSSYGWQRHADKIAQVSPAPDVLYRNTYLGPTIRDKSTPLQSDSRSHLSSPRSVSPRSQQSQQQYSRIKTATTHSSKATEMPSKNFEHPQYHTVYDYIRDSIKRIERQRNLKQQYFSTKIKRPQNDDVILRRVLRDKKNSSTNSIANRDSSPGRSPSTYEDIRSPESLINYINYSKQRIRLRDPHSAFVRYNQHQATSKRNPNNSHESSQMVMRIATTATGNS